MLKIENVSKSYGEKVAIRDISFEVPTGSTFGLLGPNGAGKTTLIRIINNIMPADAGNIYFGGSALRPEHINQIGYLPEERGLYKKMKVGEQVLYLARLKGMEKKMAVEKIKWWFDRMDMTSWWNKKVETLSKGMQQKVQFIASVLHDPKFIILDEPFSGFDPVNAEAVKNELLRLRDEGATIMLSTHRMESVEELCDHIAMIHNSEKVLEGRISEVKRKFKQGHYKVLFEGENNVSLPESIGSVLSSEFNESHLANEMIIDLNEGAQKEMVDYFITNTKMVGFEEILPSIEEIFVEQATKQA